MKKNSSVIFVHSAALLFGILLTGAFAPFNVYPLAVIAPAGLFLLWTNNTPKRAFLLGFCFGIGFFGSGVYWVFHSIHIFGGVPVLPAIAITCGFILLLALFPAFTGYFTQRFFASKNIFTRVCAAPTIWVLSEWVRSWIFTGFPWLFVGYSQTLSPLKGYAAILSVYGVSLAVLMTSTLLLNVLWQYKQKNYSALYYSLLGVILIWVIGGLLSFIPWTKPQGQPIAISLVQGNIPQSLKWSPDHLNLSLERYATLTKPLWERGKIIIWPEAAVPLPLQNARDYINMMNEQAEKHGAALILGIPAQAENEINYYNAVVTLGKNRNAYLKRRLVPFGEYIPNLPVVSQFFDFMQIPVSNLIPGKIFQEPLNINGVKILTTICYEIAFPELLFPRSPRIGFLLTLTNDAWFGDSSAQAQHLQMAQMRAIEWQRPLVFASNDGITAIIDANGRIQTAAPPHEIFVLNGTVQPMQGVTPWMKNGIDPVLLILVLLLVAARKRMRISNKQQ